MNSGKEFGGPPGEGSEQFGFGSFGPESEWKPEKRFPVRNPFEEKDLPPRGPIVSPFGTKPGPDHGDQPPRSPVKSPFGEDGPVIPRGPRFLGLPRMGPPTSSGDNEGNNPTDPVEGASPSGGEVFHKDRSNPPDEPRSDIQQPPLPPPPSDPPRGVADGGSDDGMDALASLGLDIRPGRDPFKTAEVNDAIEHEFRRMIWDVQPFFTRRETRTADGTSTNQLDEAHRNQQETAEEVDVSDNITFESIPDGDGVVLIQEKDDFPLLMRTALQSGPYPLPPDELDRSVGAAVDHVRRHLDTAEELLTVAADPGVRFLRDDETGELLVEPVVRYYNFTSGAGFKELICAPQNCGDAPKVFPAQGPEIRVSDPKDEVEGREVLTELTLKANPYLHRDMMEELGPELRIKDGELTDGYLSGDAPDLQAFYNLSYEENGLVQQSTTMVRNSLDNFAQNYNVHGKVDVGLYRDPSGLVHVVVTDNGTGVPPEEEEQLLKEPIASKKSGPDVMGRDGYDLKQLHDWAQSHGGALTYTRLEQGSRFTLTVNPHAHEYPAEAIGTVASPAEARDKLAAHYLDKLREIHALLDSAPSLTAEDAEKKGFIKDMIDRGIPDQQSRPNNMFMYHVREYIKRYTSEA